MWSRNPRVGSLCPLQGLENRPQIHQEWQVAVGREPDLTSYPRHLGDATLPQHWDWLAGGQERKCPVATSSPMGCRWLRGASLVTTVPYSTPRPRIQKLARAHSNGKYGCALQVCRLIRENYHPGSWNRCTNGSANSTLHVTTLLLPIGSLVMSKDGHDGLCRASLPVGCLSQAGDNHQDLKETRAWSFGHPRLMPTTLRHNRMTAAGDLQMRPSPAPAAVRLRCPQ